MITINDVLSKRILPFEVDNPKLIRLFSYYLHSAPTISSKSAANIEPLRLENNWKRFTCEYFDNYCFVADQCHVKTFEQKLSNHKLNSDSTINRLSKGFACKQKKGESDVACLLRHLRNSIAHSNVFMCEAGNRYYIIFDDYNPSGNQSARILLSLTHLQWLKQTIMS